MGLLDDYSMATNTQSSESNTKSLPQAWSTLVSCILVHMTLPLVPLGLELFIEGAISEKSIAITAAMYSVALSISSRWMWFVFLGFALSLIYAALFGYISRESMLEQALRHSIDSKGLWAIATLWCLHFVERFNRHIQLREPFFEFRNR